MSKDTFILPEYWYCPYSNIEELDIINKHFDKDWIYYEPNGFFGYTNKDGSNN